MRRFDGIERVGWRVISGSPSSHYRPALWRPTRQNPDSVALSEKFAGDPDASKWNRRTWRRMGVVAVRNHALDVILTRPDVEPAIAFTVGQTLVVGRLGVLRDVGVVHDVVTVNRGHGMRIGPDETRFGVGGITPDGEFITPSPEDLMTLGPVPCEMAGDVNTGFVELNFS